MVHGRAAVAVWLGSVVHDVHIHVAEQQHDASGSRCDLLCMC